MTAGTACRTCGTEPREGARFCDGCGAPVAEQDTSAEYKQVTVVFADVAHSMDIAAAVGAERLREIMTELADRSRRWCSSSAARWTSSPVTGSWRCSVRRSRWRTTPFVLVLPRRASRRRPLGWPLRSKSATVWICGCGWDLNSGEVIAGEIGSGALGYTAIGEQVGTAQRMESVAPSGGVMLSESTARLVEGAATLGEFELVDQGCRGTGARPPAVGHGRRASRWRACWVQSGRSTLGDGLPSRACWTALSTGTALVVAVVGSPGIGKSRLVREVAAMAAARGLEVFTAFCESHASDIPFYVVARLLRAAFRVAHLDASAARAQVRARVPDAEPEDVLLFDDLLGIADPEVELPKIDPDARRRRLTALVNAASLSREAPAVYVVEDAHWIDEVSESMLADFLTVIPQTPSLVLVTYRPEYEGALTRVHGAQTIALGPLSDPETAALVSAARVGPLGWRTGPPRSPRGPPVTRSSPRRSCANWPSVVCCTGSAAATCRRQMSAR